MNGNGRWGTWMVGPGSWLAAERLLQSLGLSTSGPLRGHSANARIVPVKDRITGEPRGERVMTFSCGKWKATKPEEESETT